MANAPEETLGNAFVFYGECIPPVPSPSRKFSSPVPAGAARASWSCLCTAKCNVYIQSFKIFSVCFVSFFLYCFLSMCVCVCCPHRSLTACWAGTAVPHKACRDEKHSLIFLCTVTCMTFDHTQRLSHSWIGPKGRNDSRKTTLLAGSAASRTRQSLLPHLQFVADLAKRGIQLQALWFK